MKKDLLVFFGQYRTFDITLPYFKNLDKVDVIVSTWSNELTKEKIDLIYKYIPHAIVLTNDFDKLEPRFKKDHGPMYFHWKNVIDYLDETKYEKVLFMDADTIVVKCIDHIFDYNAHVSCFIVENGNKDYLKMLGDSSKKVTRQVSKNCFYELPKIKVQELFDAYMSSKIIQEMNPNSEFPQWWDMDFNDRLCFDMNNYYRIKPEVR